MNSFDRLMKEHEVRRLKNNISALMLQQNHFGVDNKSNIEWHQNALAKAERELNSSLTS